MCYSFIVLKWGSVLGSLFWLSRVVKLWVRVFCMATMANLIWVSAKSLAYCCCSSVHYIAFFRFFLYDYELYFYVKNENERHCQHLLFFYFWKCKSLRELQERSLRYIELLPYLWVLVIRIARWRRKKSVI